MAFEHKVRGIARSIYNKVTKIIDSCKEDDYKYYTFGYFDYKDEHYIIAYDYVCDEVVITCNHSIMNFEIVIDKAGTSLKIYLDKRIILYDSGLRSMLKEVTKADKIYVKQAIDYQKNLPDVDKRRIVMMYEVAQRVIQKISYNKEKTRTMENLNDDMLDIKNDYVLKRLELEGINRYKSVDIAVNWLANLIKNNKKKIIVTDKQLLEFKMSLSNSLEKSLTECDVDEIITLFHGGVLYGTECGLIDEKLLRALTYAKISSDTIPFGTKVEISVNSVQVTKDRFEDFEVLYNNEKDININLEDIKSIRNDNLETYKAISSRPGYRLKVEECARKSLNMN